MDYRNIIHRVIYVGISHFALICCAFMKTLKNLPNRPLTLVVDWHKIIHLCVLICITEASGFLLGPLETKDEENLHSQIDSGRKNPSNTLNCLSLFHFSCQLFTFHHTIFFLYCTPRGLKGMDIWMVRPTFQFYKSNKLRSNVVTVEN